MSDYKSGYYVRQETVGRGFVSDTGFYTIGQSAWLVVRSIPSTLAEPSWDEETVFTGTILECEAYIRLAEANKIIQWPQPPQST